MRMEQVSVYYVKISGITECGGRKKRFREKELGEKLLAYSLKDYCGMILRPEEIIRTERGKPYLETYPEIHYNISHSGEYLACGVSDSPVGMDIEQHRLISLERFAEKTLSVSERESLAQSADPLKLFFDFWVMKEAYLKWTGEGITRDLRFLPLCGAGQLFFLEEGYSAALWTEKEREIVCVPVRYRELSGD